jgi:4-diphosphocytidyl-2-C-methyl-D-erythritol kinase
VPARPTTVTVRVPAKINLHLSVGRLRDDGFHDLTTVFQAVGLYDEVTVTRTDELTLRVEADSALGDSARLVPTDRTNLAARAVALLAEQTGHSPALDVLIRKRIPVAGGCAGGSADAAAALVACDALWGLGLSRHELAEIALSLGSDVPFCLYGGTALATGRGEQLTPVLGHGRYWWVLALVEGGLSTPQVYAELDRLRDSGPVAMASDPAEVLAALRLGSSPALGRARSNDLQAPALLLRPDLAAVLERGEEAGSLAGLVSGSGPTLAFLVKDEAQATTVATGLAGHCSAVRVAEGPVHGARVVRAA